MKHWLNEGLEILKVLNKAREQSNKKSKNETNTNNIFSSQGKRDSNDISRSTKSDR